MTTPFKHTTSLEPNLVNNLEDEKKNLCKIAGVKNRNTNNQTILAPRPSSNFPDRARAQSPQLDDDVDEYIDSSQVIDDAEEYIDSISSPVEQFTDPAAAPQELLVPTRSSDSSDSSSSSQSQAEFQTPSETCYVDPAESINQDESSRENTTCREDATGRKDTTYREDTTGRGNSTGREDTNNRFRLRAQSPENNRNLRSTPSRRSPTNFDEWDIPPNSLLSRISSLIVEDGGVPARPTSSRFKLQPGNDIITSVDQRSIRGSRSSGDFSSSLGLSSSSPTTGLPMRSYGTRPRRHSASSQSSREEHGGGGGGGHRRNGTSHSGAGPPIVFRPPNESWQIQRCQLLQIQLRKIHRLGAGPIQGVVMPTFFMRDTPPQTCESVAADGNCLFRALSYWIAGSEEYHMEVRLYLVRQMREKPDVFRLVVPDERVRRYLRESRMDQEGVWGTEVEIFVAATALGTPIAVYAAYGERFLWQVFEPLAINTALMSHNYMIYLQNTSNHFEPAIEI